MAQEENSAGRSAQAEATSLEVSVELEQFFTVTPGLLCIATVEGRFVKVNPAWQRVLGWSNEQLEGARVLDFMHPDDAESAQAIEHGLRQGVPIFESVRRLRCSDGSYRWIEWCCSSGDNGYVYATAHDVTQRIENERLLRESEERYRLLIELAPFMVVVHDQGRILFVNPAGVQMVGATSADQLLGRSVEDFVPPESRAGARQRFVELLRQKTAQKVEQSLVRLDGQLRDVEASSMVIPFDGKSASLLVAIDVTDRKKMEAGRLKLETQLRQSQKLESIARLAGGVAHDFNNLLTVVLGSAGSLLDRDDLDGAERADLDGITEAAQRAASLTRQLLAFSRQQVLQPRIIDAREVVTHATQMLHRVLGEDIELTLKTTHESLAVFADSGQLEQVLVSLAVNARDAMPAGGALIVEVSRTVLDAAFVAAHPDAAPGAYAHIVVTDTGRGMDEATRSRVFEPFFSTKSDLGTGLGLATVYGIIRQSNGYIWVQSEPGAGCSFKIYLPLSASLPCKETKGSDRELQKGAETILLVEDEDAVRNVIKKVLDKAGYKVLLAANGEQGLVRAKEHPHPIHLLLTDVVMPKMTGRELAERIVQSRPDTRVLYMSGYTPDAIVHQGVLEVGIQFIQKPLLPSQLLAKIRSILDGT